MSFLRRFVYMVLLEGPRVHGGRPFYTVHRINTSRLFSPSTSGSKNNGSLIEEATLLPPVCARFSTPPSEYDAGKMELMLLSRDKLLAADMTGRTSIYDEGLIPSLGVVRSGPTFQKPPMDWPVSVPVAGDLYVLDSGCCFQGLVHSKDLVYPDLNMPKGPDIPNEIAYEDWRCHRLPPPPGVTPPASTFTGHTVVGGNTIWLSLDGTGTLTFDVAQSTWAKQGKWLLPFSGLAEYVPEHKLWFGISSDRDSGNPLCAVDMATEPEPAVRKVWKQEVDPRKSKSKNWEMHSSYLVHLGSGRFCIARIFSHAESEWQWHNSKQLAVFTAVEVVGNGNGNRLRMVKHKSVCYDISSSNPRSVRGRSTVHKVL